MHLLRTLHSLPIAFGVRTPSIFLRIPSFLWWYTVKWLPYRTKSHPYCNNNNNQLIWFWMQFFAFENVIYLRDDWISAWLKGQRATIETFDRIFSNSLVISTITRFSCIPFLFMVRINGSRSTISSVTSHLEANVFWNMKNSQNKKSSQSLRKQTHTV